MIAPFDASKLKLERAATHLRELETAITSYFNEKPCAVVVELMRLDPPHPPCQAWTARIRKPVPPHLASVIGDVVHNLRTSLDLLACDLVRLKGKSTKKVYFPFCDQSVDLKDAIKKRYMHRAGDDVVRIIESLKPYRGGNAALRAIHDMDISDTATSYFANGERDRSLALSCSILVQLMLT
jgi:hypothetical protein